MNLLVFVVDGRIIKCHHISFLNMADNNKEPILTAMLGDENFQLIETLLVREILSVQYEENK
jgi:hypothetical protein